MIGIDEMLAQFGITQTTMSAYEREALDREGYVVLPGAIDVDWLARYEKWSSWYGLIAGIHLKI